MWIQIEYKFITTFHRLVSDHGWSAENEKPRRQRQQRQKSRRPPLTVRPTALLPLNFHFHSGLMKNYLLFFHCARVRAFASVSLSHWIGCTVASVDLSRLCSFRRGTVCFLREYWLPHNVRLCRFEQCDAMRWE